MEVVLKAVPINSEKTPQRVCYLDDRRVSLKIAKGYWIGHSNFAKRAIKRNSQFILTKPFYTFLSK